MAKEELPLLEYDAKFDGYDYFDPRGFWEKVAVTDRNRQAPKSSPEGAAVLEMPKLKG